MLSRKGEESSRKWLTLNTICRKGHEDYPHIPTQTYTTCFLAQGIEPWTSTWSQGNQCQLSKTKNEKHSYFQRNHIHVKFKAKYTPGMRCLLSFPVQFSSQLCKSLNELRVEHLLWWALCQVLRGPQRWMRWIPVF